MLTLSNMLSKFQRIVSCSLVEQIKITNELLFEINKSEEPNIIEDFMDKCNPQNGNLAQEVLVDVLKKNLRLTIEEKKKAEEFYSKNFAILEDLFLNYFVDMEKYSIADLKKKYNLSEMANHFKQEFSKQIKQETIEVIKLLYQEFGSLAVSRNDFIEIFNAIFSLSTKSQNITTLLIPQLVEMINNSSTDSGFDCDLAETALNAIGTIKHEAIIPLLADYLFFGERIYSDWEAYYDDAVCIRVVAVKLFGKHKNKKAVEFLLRSLDESVGSVVLHAIRSLGEIGDKEVIPAIYQFLPGILKVRNPEYWEGGGGITDCPEFIYVYNENCQKVATEVLQKFGEKPDMNIGVKLLLRRSFLLLIDLPEKRELDLDRFFELGETELLRQTLVKYPVIFRKELNNLKNELINESKISEEKFNEAIQRLKDHYIEDFPAINQ